MRLPDFILNEILALWLWAAALLSLVVSVYFARRQTVQPTALHFAGFTSLVFTAQMLGFNTLIGVSGSILGTTFLVATVGPGFALISVGLILGIQAVFFGDGGILSLGANILGAALSVLINAVILRQMNRFPKLINLALASWFSGLGVAVYVALLLCNNHLPMVRLILPDMLELHAWVAIGRSLATMAFIVIFCGEAAWPTNQVAFRISPRMLLFSALVLAIFFAPYSSQLPSMVESIMEKYHLASSPNQPYHPWFNDYALPGQNPSPFSLGLCGVLGALLSYCLASWIGACALVFPKASNPTAAQGLG